MAKELHNLPTSIRPFLHLHEHASSAGQRADRRHMVTRHWYVQPRRLSTRGIRAHPRGQQVEARFVYPDDGPPFRMGFFLSAGQRSVCHMVTAASSRWVACVTGSCTR